MTGNRLAGFIAALLLGLGFAGSGSAAPTTWAFEGYVSAISAEQETLDALSSLGVEPGSPFSGQLVFESDTPDDDADPATGSYPGTISLFEVTIGSYHEVVSIDSFNGIVVSRTDLAVDFYGFVNASAYGPGSYALFDDPGLMLELPGEPPLGIGSDALPLFPPALTSYDYPELAVAGIDGVIEGDLTQIMLVPGAGAGALLALSLAAVCALRRRTS